MTFANRDLHNLSCYFIYRLFCLYIVWVQIAKHAKSWPLLWTTASFPSWLQHFLQRRTDLNKKTASQFSGRQFSFRQHALTSGIFAFFSSENACFVVLTGLEPVTSPMWTARSNQLNYKTLLCSISNVSIVSNTSTVCDSKVSSSTASISCVSVGIFVFFRGLNVHCVQYLHGVCFWLQHSRNT